MINRDSRGRLYSIVRGEILGFIEDKLLRKHSPRMFSLISERKLGDRRRSLDRSQDLVVYSTHLVGAFAPGHITKLWGSRANELTYSHALRSPVYRLNVDGRAPPGLVSNIVASSASRRKIAGRYRRSLNHKLCRLGIGRCYYFDPFGTLREIKVWVLGGVWSQG